MAGQGWLKAAAAQMTKHGSTPRFSPKKESVMHTNYRDLHEHIPPERRGYTVGVPNSQPSTITIDDSELHQQVLDIIQSVLSTTDARSDVRRRLLRHLAENPGHPEQALLEHLRERNRNGGAPRRSAGRQGVGSTARHE
jgi:hypothetical protein